MFGVIQKLNYKACYKTSIFLIVNVIEANWLVVKQMYSTNC